jgi:prepilin-type N-terminal cleavage/methylation domain-containing protein
MFMKTRPRNRGVTLIEVLLVVVLLVVLTSFAIPTFSGANVQAEMRVAGESLQFAIRTARNTARLTESDVSMVLESGPDGTGHRITFAAPGAAGSNRAFDSLQDLHLDDRIAVVSTAPSFEFDRQGLVRTPGQIILVSRLDESATARIDVK